VVELKIGEVVVKESEVDGEERKVLEGYLKDGVMSEKVMGVLVKVMKGRRVEGSGGSGGKEGEESKSSKIRKLVAAGMSKGEVAKLLGVRFQFVYNVMEKEGRKKK
jgi:DNA invertase Pin-like site-specific DNA recombinase